MKRFFLTFLAVSALTVALSAQSAKPAADGKTTPDYFRGTIEYIVKEDPMAPAAAVQNHSDVDFNDEVKPAGEAGDSEGKTAIIPKLMADKESQFFSIGNLFFLSYEAKYMIGMTEPKTLRQTVLDPCAIFPACNVLMEMDKFHMMGDMVNYTRLFNDVYIRTEETRTIADVQCVKYNMMTEGMEGEIWVAEDINLRFCMMPFMGMYHPVMACEFRLPNSDMKPYSMVATRVTKNTKLVINDYLGKFAGSDEIDLQEIMTILSTRGVK